MTIVTINKVDRDHLEAVKAEMLVLGAPVIRAVYDEGDNVYYALEGSHRLYAADELGITPVIDVVEYSDEMITVQVDGYDEDVMISDYVDFLMSSCGRNSHFLTFDDED